VILPGPQAWHALQGRKTQHRTRRLPGQPRSTHRPGVSYPIQPAPGQPAIGRVIITRVDLATLADLTPDDIHAEGHLSLAAYARAWLQANDPTYRPALPHCTDAEALERYGRHTHRPVWVHHLIPDPQAPPRFLHRNSERGYTTRAHDALPHEPEAVDAWTQHRITSSAHHRHAEHLAAELAELDRQQIADRIHLLERAARQAAVDVTRELRALRRRAADLHAAAQRAGVDFTARHDV